MVEAIVSAGGPAALITTVKEPTLETGQAIMTHPDIPLLSITGGEAVVRVAMKTGKKVIAAGPGNPPVIVGRYGGPARRGPAHRGWREL